MVLMPSALPRIPLRRRTMQVEGAVRGVSARADASLRYPISLFRLAWDSDMNGQSRINHAPGQMCYDTGDMPANRTATGRFAPGQSGNPDGRPRDAESLSAQLRDVLEEQAESGKTKARLIAEKMVELGLAGNVHALSAVFDRMDGKPAQALTFKGDDTAPLHVLHTDRMEGWQAPSGN